MLESKRRICYVCWFISISSDLHANFKLRLGRSHIKKSWKNDFEDTAMASFADELVVEKAIANELIVENVGSWWVCSCSVWRKKERVQREGTGQGVKGWWWHRGRGDSGTSQVRVAVVTASQGMGLKWEMWGKRKCTKVRVELANYILLIIKI